MADAPSKSPSPLPDRIARIAPGLAMLARYRLQALPHDLTAGLSVAAVALPVGVRQFPTLRRAVRTLRGELAYAVSARGKRGARSAAGPPHGQ